MNYKIIFSDLDKTLLNSERKVSERNIDSINKYVKENNSFFCLASGRPPYFMEKIASEFAQRENFRYLICYNGGVIFDRIENKTIFEHNFDNEKAEKIAKFMDKNDVRVVIFDDELAYTNKGFEHLKSHYGGRARLVNFSSFDFSKIKIHKLSAFRFDKKLPAEILDLAEFALYGEKDGLVNSEISPKGINKSVGAKCVCDVSGVKLEESLAFGDASNDVEMLKTAGKSVAPANAEESARSVVDEISEFSNDENFIAEFLQKIKFS